MPTCYHFVVFLKTVYKQTSELSMQVCIWNAWQTAILCWPCNEKNVSAGTWNSYHLTLYLLFFNSKRVLVSTTKRAPLSGTFWHFRCCSSSLVSPGRSAHPRLKQQPPPTQRSERMLTPFHMWGWDTDGTSMTTCGTELSITSSSVWKYSNWPEQVLGLSCSKSIEETLGVGLLSIYISLCISSSVKS